MPTLEQLSSTGKNEEKELVLADLKKLSNNYRMRGFPINLPFTDIEAIIEAVYNTDIHSNQDSTIEFSLAVYCHPFINGVTCVWVYFASLSKVSR